MTRWVYQERTVNCVEASYTSIIGDTAQPGWVSRLVAETSLTGYPSPHPLLTLTLNPHDFFHMIIAFLNVLATC